VRRVKILTVSSLFPNAADPSHGVFVENRLRHLAASGVTEHRVVAPVPWVPPGLSRMERYRKQAAAPRAETRHGIPVDHPRFAVIPRVGMTAAPFLLYAGAVGAVERVKRGGFDFDLIDAHYFYPDGVAAILLGRRFRRPVTITARGTDVNLIPRYALPRRMIRWAARNAAGMITVAQALKDDLTAIGVAPERIRVLRNGVDLAMFKPADRAKARAALGLTGPTLLSVGHLIPRKANELIVGAMPKLPGFTLLIAGDGPDRAMLDELVARLGLGGRVRFLGRQPHERLAELYTAADALVLASSREGWANVLLESMACGTPAIASDAGGSAEVVAAPEAGRILPERSAAAIAAAVTSLFAAPPDRAATRAYAERFGWDETTRGQINLFKEILGRTDPCRAVP
jgi:glycosyltransferase involved in cell wall biosynthesis